MAENIGFIIGWLGMSFLRLLYNGIVTMCKRYKVFIAIYLGLILSIVVSYYYSYDYSIPIFAFFCTDLVAGIWNYILEYPEMKLKKQFRNIFSKINFLPTPIYVSQEKSEFCTIYHFYSLCPLSDWKQIREELEMYLNKKIIDIIQEEDNNRIIYLIVQSAPLPKRFDWDDQYLVLSNEPLFSLGMGYYDLVLLDLRKTPHTFVAGETGSGKSNLLKCLIHQALMKEYDVVLIDFKRAVSFQEFSKNVTVYYEHETVKGLLEQLVDETKQRLDLFRKTNVDNIDDYQKNINEYLRRKIVFIDELAELLQVRDRALSHSLYDSLETLTRLSRSAGIHLVMGMQRVDSTLISGQIKTNVSGRVCGRFVDKEPSRIMLNNDMASKLLNVKGRFIFKDDNFIEFQAFFYQSTTSNYKEPYGSEPSESAEESPQKDIQEEALEKVQEKSNTESDISFDFSDIIQK